MPSPSIILPTPASAKKLIEAFIRLGYYGYISYVAFKTTFDLDVQEWKVLFGSLIVFTMIQLFLLNHLLQGIRLLFN